MTATNELAEIGALIGNPARAKMLLALMDGGTRSAGGLANDAGLTAQTVSWHLAQLTDAEIVARVKEGRHVYYRLASSRVASILESALVLTAANSRRRRPASARDETLRQARTCYDHLAGHLGVALTSALVHSGSLLLSDDGGEITRRGALLLQEFGINVPALARLRRVFCRPCLDWTEQRPHLAGAIGAAIAARCFELEWLARIPGTRAVSITPHGHNGLKNIFEITI